MECCRFSRYSTWAGNSISPLYRQRDQNLSAAQTTGFANKYRYTGQYWAGEDAGYYFRHRNYNEKMGRLLTRDPQEVYTYYMYAQNNPLFYTDPMGLFHPQHHLGIGSHAAQLANVKQQYVYSVGYSSILSDFNNMIKEWQPAHYMRNDYMTPLEALTLYDYFIDYAFNTAVVFCNNGDIVHTIEELGFLLHDIADSTVAVHGYEKQWWPNTRAETYYHVLYELGVPRPLDLQADIHNGRARNLDALNNFRNVVDKCKCELFNDQ